MPRRASDRVVTHRIELSPYERDRFEEYATAQLLSKTAVGLANAVATAIGGAGLILGGWAALEWIGIPLGEKIKEKTEGISTGLADFIDKIPGSESSRISKDGEELIELQRIAALLHADMPIYCDSSQDTFNKYRCNKLQEVLKKNIDQQEILRAGINAAAAGQTKWDEDWMQPPN